MVTAFGTLALLLAVIGLYGVVSYSVLSRRRELAVRLALGATRQEVVMLVLRDGAGIMIVEILLGLALSAAVGRGLNALLFDVRALDPATYAVVTAVVCLITLVASTAPALRASTVPLRDVLIAE